MPAHDSESGPTYTVRLADSVHSDGQDVQGSATEYEALPYDLSLMPAGLEVSHESGGLEPVQAALEAEQPGLQVVSPAMATDGTHSSHPEKTAERSIYGLEPRTFWLSSAALVNLAIIGLGVGLGVGLTRGDTHSTATEQPAIEAYRSREGAWNGPGFALTGQGYLFHASVFPASLGRHNLDVPKHRLVRERFVRHSSRREKQYSYLCGLVRFERNRVRARFLYVRFALPAKQEMITPVCTNNPTRHRRQQHSPSAHIEKRHWRLLARWALGTSPPDSIRRRPRGHASLLGRPRRKSSDETLVRFGQLVAGRVPMG